MSIHIDDGSKADKALKLKEQGIGSTAIAEWLGVNPKNLPGMYQRARQRRAAIKVNNILERTANTAEKVPE